MTDKYLAGRDEVTELEQKYVADRTQGISEGYDDSTFGQEDGGDYVSISVGRYIRPYDRNGIRIGSGYTLTHDDFLDPVGVNTSVAPSEYAIKPQTVAVPVIEVPAKTVALTTELQKTDPTTAGDQATADEVKKLADEIKDIKEPKALVEVNVEGTPNDKNLDPIHLISKTALPEYSELSTNATTPQTTQESVPCRPEHEPDPADLEEASSKLEDSKEMRDMLKRLEDLLSEPTDTYKEVEPVSMCSLTEKTVSGAGAFDQIGMALFNQLHYGLNNGIIDKADIRAVYSAGLQEAMQTGLNFALQRDQAYWQNLAVKSQMINANVQALLAKAELIMMPTKVKLAYAQLQVQMRQLDLLNYQIKQAKYQIPQILAQTDQIREQTAVICQQKKMAVEQLAQTEFDRKLKQEQVTGAQLENQVKAETIAQAKQQTKLLNSQVQNSLKDIKIKEAQLIQMRAQLKLQAQQLLKDKEQMALIKSQVASQYANITALQEQIKVARAQYSDTINGKPIGGVIGAQIRVNKAQAAGFDKSAMNNFLNQLQSGWSAKKTADIATLSPNAFNALGLDRAINWMATKYFEMPNDVFKMPQGYADYLTDGEMDATVPTASSNNSYVDKTTRTKGYK